MIKLILAFIDLFIHIIKEFLDLGFSDFKRKLGSIPESEPLYKILKSRSIDLSKIKPRKPSKPDNISSIATPVICNPCVRDRFDKIYCIHYLPYTERFECIKSELNRIGILNLP